MPGKLTNLDGPMPLGLQALAAMHAKDEAAGINPFQVERVSVLPQPTRVEQSFRIEPPDWAAEAAERLALEQEQERQERARVVAEELAKIDPADPPPTPTPPARRGWRKPPP